ncbi:MAG TPA: hypothetical protein V6D29_13685 [Leptolyngbyaceae cyanobacterium]
MHQFEVGKPACPVACQYCHVTELDADRTAAWSKGLLGINKACTFMNVPPWIAEDEATQKQFYQTPWHLFTGDFAGWTAVTDGMMPKLLPYFWHWVERVSPVAKLVTVVTKWSINAQLMQELASIPNLFLVVTITGNEPPIERIPSRVHLRTLALAKEYGVRCLPMCHPYIAGVSDLSFLPHLKSLGYSEFCVKGLRYNPDTMGSWMPQTSKPLYEGHGIEEVLPEDGWRERVADAGLTLLSSPKEWYWRDGIALPPGLNRASAIAMVDQLLTMANIASSAPQEVRESAISRRLAR